MSSVSLQSLLTPSKTVEVDYPGVEGFKVKINFLSREEIVKLRKKCITTSFNKRTRQPEDKFDDELFLKLYTAATIKGWSGLKYSILNELMLVDISAQRPDDELGFTDENALILIKNSSEFDSFVTEVTSDLSNFTKYSSMTSNAK